MRCPAVPQVLPFKVGRRYGVLWAYWCRMAEIYCPAVDAKCRMAEIYRKETQGSVLAWRAASLLLNRLLFLY